MMVTNRSLFGVIVLALSSLSLVVNGELAQYTFKCGSTVYMCGSKVTEDTMCRLAGTKTVVRGTAGECKTMTGVVKGANKKSTTLFSTKCPNGSLLSIYTKYNAEGKNGIKCSKASCVQCKGAHCGGDPHFMTYDGTGYTYHGKCDLVMARSANLHNTGLTLDVNARTSIQGDWSYISNVATRIGDDVLEITSTGSHYFNGVEGTDFPLEIGGRYVATRVDRKLGSGDIRTDYTIDLMIHSDDHASGDVIRISSFKQMLSVTVDAMLHDTYGMLGITGQDGMIGRDLQTVLHDSNIMGAQWQVNNTEAMLFQEIRAPQYPEACQLPKVDSRRRLRNESGENMRRAQEACAAVEEDAMREFCMHDVLQTGDSSYALPYFQ